MVANGDVVNAGRGNKCRRLCCEHKVIVLSICLIVIGLVVGILLILVMPILLKKVERPFRLPRDVLPYQYEVEVKPYLIPGDFKFEGKVAIHVSCFKKTDSIILHIKNLTINERSIRVTSIDGDEDYEVLLVDYDTTNDLLILQLLEDLKERTRYRIHIDYTGILTDKGSGIYVSSYVDDRNATRYIASTGRDGNEPTAARMIFPCFDEPQLKSTFNITLVRWDSMITLSNMPKLRTENRGGFWRADIYKESMKMSTYLVAFIFCEYVGTTKGKVTVWTPEHRRNDTMYALHVADKSLDFLEKKLDMVYPGPKLDMVAVPFLLPGALENWGLIIYQQDTLLTPEDKSKEDGFTISTITRVVSHEIAHQWFGNLVTVKWWSDLWLKEGITSYMETLIEAQILPEWNQVELTSSADYECNSRQPLWRPVHNWEEARAIFDDLSYERGKVVTRMAHLILGEDVFWRGIRRYLNAFSYDSAEESDFWKHLTEAQLHKPIKERLDMEKIMHPWTHLIGNPIVTSHRDYYRRKIIISQQSCKKDEKEHEHDIWNIPLIFGAKRSGKKSNLFEKIIWLTARNITVEDMPEQTDWVAINTNGIGYYMVNYDRKNWELLCNELMINHTTFQPTERYKLLVDVITLARMGYNDIDLVFQCLIYTREENEALILEQQLQFLLEHLHYFDEERYTDLMKEFAIHVWKRVYDKYGWVENKNDTRILRPVEMAVAGLVINGMCEAGYDPCVQEAFNRYKIVKNSGEQGRFGSYKYNVLCTVSVNATFDEWNSMMDLYKPEYHERLPLAVCSDEASIIREELRRKFKGAEETLFDLSMLEFIRGRIAFDEYWKFVDNHFDKIPTTQIKVPEDAKFFLKEYGSASKFRRIIQVLENLRRKATGSKAENTGKVIEYFKKILPTWEKNEELLKKWLERKLWRRG